MTRVEDALTWSGRGADVSVFVVMPSGSEVHLDTAVGGIRPLSSMVFLLEQDDPPLLPDLDVVEVDAHLASLPIDVAGYPGHLLQRVLDDGAVVAWCAFEGSFHFEHLLTGDIAHQVYGVASRANGVRLAVDDVTRSSPAWTEVVRSARAAVVG